MKSLYKFSSCIIAAVAVLSSLSPLAAEKSNENAPPDISAESAILIEQSSGAVIFKKNELSPRAPASITKTMTMLLTIEAVERGDISLEDKVTASERACNLGGTEIWLLPGEKMSVKDLLKAVAVSSANDAACALAEYVGESEENFVKLMNERAQSLGLSDTVFKNSHGLDEDGHTSCAYDIAKISAELLRHPLTKEFTTVWMDYLRNGETQLVNTNKLVRFYKGATGVKTGTTDNAGFCISASAERHGLSLIAVVLGARDNDARFEDAKALLNYGFENYAFAPLPELSEPIPPVSVKFGREEQVEAVPAPPDGVLVKKELLGSLKLSGVCETEITAPVKENQKLGEVKVTAGEDVICTYPIVAKTSVSAMTLPFALITFLKSVISL